MSAIRILHLEDDSMDAELIGEKLREGGLTVEICWVTNKEDFENSISSRELDIILADYSVPGFDGEAALAMAHQRLPTVPFLFVSGYIAEEVALESLKLGATDYVFKTNLARLVPAVGRALQEAKDQRERREAQMGLQERESILRSFFNTAPFMMGIVELLSDDILHISANAACARFLGTTPESMRNQRARELGVPVPVVEEYLRRFREAQQKGRPVEFETVWATEQHSRQLSAVVSQLPSVPGQSPRFCYVSEDVTDKKQLEQQFLRAQRLESIGTLASGIAHDLNNVLAPIIMALKLFRPKLTDPDDQELLATLESSARHGADIVRQVLTFARGVEGARQPMDLERLFNELEKIARDTFPRSIQVESSVPSDLWKTVGDTTQVYQVLMNLCVNARDAMPSGGRLQLRAENLILREDEPKAHPDAHPGPYVVLTVSDTGSGMKPEVLSRIFDPFFTTKEVGKGTGLGLPTAQTIVRSHGGFINVASELNRGTEFKVYLPAQDHALPQKQESSAATIPRGNGELILVVDDEASIRQVTRTTLREQGYEVITAADGAEALTLFSRHKNEVKLIVTDIMMPNMDGAVLIQSLLKVDPHVKIIAVSGLLDSEGHYSIPESTQVVCLPKPFTAEKLLLMIHERLHQNQTPSFL